MYMRLYVKCSFFPILIKPELSQEIFEKHSNIKFNEHPCSGSRVLPSGRTHTHTYTKHTKQLVGEYTSELQFVISVCAFFEVFSIVYARRIAPVWTNTWQQCTLHAKAHFYVGVKQYPCGTAASKIHCSAYRWLTNEYNTLVKWCWQVNLKHWAKNLSHCHSSYQKSRKPWKRSWGCVERSRP